MPAKMVIGSGSQILRYKIFKSQKAKAKPAAKPKKAEPKEAKKEK